MNFRPVGTYYYHPMQPYINYRPVYVPYPTYQISSIGNGIKNIGNSCYIASTVQALHASKSLTKKLMTAITRKEGETLEEFAEREAIQKALQTLVKALPQNQMVTQKITELRRAIFDNKSLNADLSIHKSKSDPTTKQQDAATLMMLILEVIDAPFELETKWWVEDLPKPSPIIKPYYLLGIEIKKGKNLQQLVDEAFAPTQESDLKN